VAKRLEEICEPTKVYIDEPTFRAVEPFVIATKLRSSGYGRQSDHELLDRMTGLEERLSRESESAELFYELGKVNFELHDATTAIRYFERALALDPQSTQIKLAYADGAVEERDVLLPDYYYDAPAGDTNVFSLAKHLPKWDAVGKMAERDHHYLHGVDVHPNAGKELVSVQVTKTAPAYLVFWGATGVTED